MLIDQTELIQQTPVCGGLRKETLQLILSQSEELEVAAGEFFFREGDAGDCLYVIQSGTAIVQRTWQGNAIVLARIQPGDCFGEMSLIDLQRRFAGVKAETDCSVIRVPYTALMRLCQVDMEQYAMVMMNLGREVSRRLRIAGERLFRYQQELGQQWFDEELAFDA
ncbi:cAMP-activated global transcriptional regulator CRP [Stieleria neptunia]|uniref:cAMP-activated global transcriptional regulator CRP n=1 Tax=Stieleria neptunia TaxID=2527979 RepID=A0A518HIR3_9BACT|nr:cyclic nucleotide-binding domain-containing protein [Stieleria neptunia]QDV40744.1 cAMP-activated global transcriptional regulator CRP [Stieleria neptunia]